MRVNSGSLKNRLLQSPKDSLVRPTSDKVRGALFSSLYNDIVEATFLDLFAGSGAVGVEAFSRGARFVTFMDIDTSVVELNSKLLPREAYTIIKGDIFSYKISRQFDIVFIDPPYSKYNIYDVLRKVYDLALLADHGVLIYEESSRVEIDFSKIPFEMVRSRNYGGTTLIYFEKKIV